MPVDKQPNLLAQQGLFRGYATKLGAYFHIDTKEVTRKFIGLAWKKYEPLIEWKLKNGWVKDHCAAEIECFDAIARLMMHPLNKKAMSGWKDENDPNYIMTRRVVYIATFIRDEDSYWDMLFLAMDKWRHEHWDRYERSAEQAYQLVSFPVMYRKLLEHAEAMEEELPDITDEPDPQQIDYIKMEKRLTDGKDNEGKRARESQP